MLNDYMSLIALMTMSLIRYRSHQPKFDDFGKVVPTNVVPPQKITL
jgi:hypothetical protein